MLSAGGTYTVLATGILYVTRKVVGDSLIFNTSSLPREQLVSPPTQDSLECEDQANEG